MNNFELVIKQEILGKEFVVYGSIEEPLFLAKSIAEWIEYDLSSVNKMLANVDEDEKVRKIIPTLGGNQDSWFLTENGLYEVLMLSRKPVAKEFKKAIKTLLHELRIGKSVVIPSKSKEEIAIADKEARSTIASIYMKLSEKYSNNKDYSQILDAYATKALEDKFVLPLPKLEEENYSANEVGKLLGISSHMVGKIANKLHLKVDGEYGKWYVDKSPYSSKEVNVFRYTQKAIDLIKKEIA